MSGNESSNSHADHSFSDVPHSAPPTLLWQNHLLGGPFVHTAQQQLHQQLQQQQLQQQQQQLQQQQQQHYNELIYNMHADAFANPGHPEIYSVLPVGHGNFLKVYHCQENAENLLHPQQPPPHLQQQFQLQQQQQHQQQLQQHLPSYHLPQGQSAQPLSPLFNSYELFSSSTLMPTPENSISSLSPVALARELSTPLLLNNINSLQDDISNAANINDPLSSTTADANNATNTIINNLVNNWSPNLTGNTYTQFDAAMSQVQSQVSEIPQTTVLPETNINHKIMNMQASPPLAQHTESSPAVKTLLTTSLSEPLQTVLPEKNTLRDFPREQSLGSNKAQSTVPTVNSVPEVKKRIVAEVKPMRMTYSDVLSKLNNQQSSNASVNSKLPGSKGGKVSISISTNQQLPVGKSCSETPARRQTANGRDDDGEKLNAKTTKRSSPIHQDNNNKENVQQSAGNKNMKRTVNISNNNNGNTNVKPNLKPTKGVTEANTKKRSGNNNNNTKRNDNDFQADKKPSPAVEKDYHGFYNVTAAKNNDTYERPPKSTTTNSGNSNVNSRRSNKSGGSSFNSTSNHQKPRYTNASASNYSIPMASSSNNNSSSAYSYSSKRNRGGGGNSYTMFASSATVVSNRNYELAQRLLRTWAVYTLKVLNWLFYLVYDIVVLGCSMVYDRLTQAYELGIVYATQLHRELQQNSHKPSIWLRQQWRRFDACFKKDSRWALWRRFYKKKPTESSTDAFKTGSGGRLPQTGEEAMYSLLNCKGKDAYSILGVPHDSSQEQIRKHYKKIAVLVHPDKNKQAGAEEAFKVLQRAFELIGEPENRLAYNQSLAEALHAEKAWTELHDLLSQLQTKITEAANTIRCSTCGLRHPRKLTGRPHYAARECASCKIRHSAREGDIWAETSFLGLRWKYLALMEGKVYDITEWANCQKGALSHLESNSHLVQYRIVRGAQQQQQQQQQQQHQQTQAQQGKQQHHSPPQQSNSGGSGGKYKRDIPPSEASLHEFLDNLYSGQHPNPQAGNFSAFSSSARSRRSRRN